MSKGTLSIIIILVVIIAGGLVWYFGFYNTETNTADTSTQENANTAVANTNELPIKHTESPILVFFLEPNSGKLAGGNTVTITGGNFLDGSKVFFGDNESADVTVVSDTEITAVVPSATTEGLVNVKIQNPDKISGILQDGYTYTDSEAGE